MSVEISEQEIWAMIWKVAPQMEGTRSLKDGDQEIINRIAQLRTEEKLSSQQCQILNEIGINKAIDYDGF